MDDPRHFTSAGQVENEARLHGVSPRLLLSLVGETSPADAPPTVAERLTVPVVDDRETLRTEWSELSRQQSALADDLAGLRLGYVLLIAFSLFAVVAVVAVGEHYRALYAQMRLH